MSPPKFSLRGTRPLRPPDFDAHDNSLCERLLRCPLFGPLQMMESYNTGSVLCIERIDFFGQLDNTQKPIDPHKTSLALENIPLDAPVTHPKV